MNKDDKKTLKKILPMSLCCLLPIIAILSVPAISTFLPNIGKFMYLLAPLLCPILMGGMMFFMAISGKNSSCCSDKE